ncbi:MAG TPA: ATP-binding protein [Candidatus Acidoferrum sp.]|nr:ATP-binding protein [Candidatus Acidoferrum sp.]
MAEVLTPGSVAGLKVTKAQQRSPHLNILIYGDYGVGKTVLLGSAQAVEAMQPLLLLDYEGGTESLRRTYPDVDVLRVQNWEDMQRVYDELHRTGGNGYKTIGLDSLSEIQKFSMYDIMEKRSVDALARGDEVDPDIPGIREWGKNIEQTRKFVRAFRDLPVHTIFTALSKDDKDQRTGKRKTLPSLSGRVAQEVPAFLDVVVYYYMKRVGDEEKRMLLCNATEGNTAKDRTGRLPLVLEEPTMAKIFEHILGGTTTTTDNIDIEALTERAS